MPAPDGKARVRARRRRRRSGVVRRAAMNALTYVRGQEATTFKALAKFVRDDVDRHAAIQALQRIPAAVLARRRRPSRCSTALIAYVRKVPAADRTSPAALDALQLGRRAGGAAARRPGQGGPQGAGRAGRPRDPHRHACSSRCSSTRTGSSSRPASRSRSSSRTPTSCRTTSSITQPGALEEIGTAGRGDGHAARRGRSGSTCPQSNKILLASRLLQPRESQKLELHRPDASRASIPTSAPIPATGGGCTGRCTSSTTSTSTSPTPRRYLAEHPLPIADELLKFEPPAQGVEVRRPGRRRSSQLGTGRSFGNGKQIFQVASCVACHKHGRRRQRVRPRPDQARPEADAGRHPPATSSSRRAKINEKYQIVPLRDWRSARSSPA